MAEMEHENRMMPMEAAVTAQKAFATLSGGEGSRMTLGPEDRIEEEAAETKPQPQRTRRAATSLSPAHGRVRYKVAAAKWDFNRLGGTKTKAKEQDQIKEVKTYKKSLEQYYFVSSMHPMRQSRDQKTQAYWSQLDTSASKILREQLSHDHWKSGFRRDVGDIAMKLRESRNVKTPGENFPQRNDVCRLSPEKSVTRSCVKRPRIKGF